MKRKIEEEHKLNKKFKINNDITSLNLNLRGIFSLLKIR